MDIGSIGKGKMAQERGSALWKNRNIVKDG